MKISSLITILTILMVNTSYACLNDIATALELRSDAQHKKLKIEQAYRERRNQLDSQLLKTIQDAGQITDNIESQLAAAKIASETGHNKLLLENRKAKNAQKRANREALAVCRKQAEELRESRKSAADNTTVGNLNTLSGTGSRINAQSVKDQKFCEGSQDYIDAKQESLDNFNEAILAIQLETERLTKTLDEKQRQLDAELATKLENLEDNEKKILAEMEKVEDDAKRALANTTGERDTKIFNRSLSCGSFVLNGGKSEDEKDLEAWKRMRNLPGGGNKSSTPIDIDN